MESTISAANAQMVSMIKKKTSEIGTRKDRDFIIWGNDWEIRNQQGCGNKNSHCIENCRVQFVTECCLAN